ncbi:U-scoloptoxin(05)-Sm1a-like [Brevipalpus obovatus]|uniref:U-scoloptoxin(05)-Sm1a-like n=1 Tax=Brevipalpus obovatus TaxID=246614 RepID=UPI003D9E570B
MDSSSILCFTFDQRKFNFPFTSFILPVIILGLIINPVAVDGVGCFTCNSRNRSNPACHDPFHPANATYYQQCKVGKQNHVGSFPAYFCIKMKGVNKATKEEVVVRFCSIENMENQCGNFVFNDDNMEGCLLTCHTDGCNGSNSLTHSKLNFMLYLSLCLFMIRNCNTITFGS